VEEDESESGDDEDEGDGEHKSNRKRTLTKTTIQKEPFFLDADVTKRLDDEYTKKADELL